MKKERIALTPKETLELEELGVDFSIATLAFRISEMVDDEGDKVKPRFSLTTVRDAEEERIFHDPTLTLTDIMSLIESYSVLDDLDSHYEVTFKKTHEFEIGTRNLRESVCVAKYEYGDLFDRGEYGKSHTETGDCMIEAAFKLLVWIVKEHNMKVKSELK